jgi:TolA-binding protein
MPRTSLSGPWVLLLFAGTLICVGYIAAQQNSSQRPGATPSAKPPSGQATPQQQNDQLRDQLAQLQMQVKDLQVAIDDLKTEQQATEATVKESRDLLLDSRVMQTQGRQDLNSAIKAAGLNERRMDKLEQQISSMMLDLRRVKTKVGIY